MACVLADLRGDPANRPDPSSAKATPTTEQEAFRMLEQEGFPYPRPPYSPTDRPAWLVVMNGEFVFPIERVRVPAKVFYIMATDGTVLSVQLKRASTPRGSPADTGS